MKTATTIQNRENNNRVFIAYVTALAFALTTLLPQSSQASPLTPPEVPPTLQVPAGNHVFLKGHAVGAQQYVCLKPGTGTPWAFFGPQATLFKDNGKQILTHFLSSNPDEGGTARPTWQDSKDTSTVWAKPIATYSDAPVVEPGAIPWLLLEVVGTQEGPTGGDKLTATTFIHRVNTSKGVAPSDGCSVPADLGKKALVEYETDYYFYTDGDSDTDDSK